MKSIESRGELVTPLKGYVKKGVVNITAGSRRLASCQALEAQGKTIYLPVVLINEPKTEEEIAAAILDSAVDNNFRASDSPTVLHKSFEILRKMGLSFEKIGEATGFSHQKAYNLLKAFEIKPLRDAIVKGEISDRAASEYFTEAYVKKGKDGKPETRIEEREGGKKSKVKVFDEEKIAKALSEAKASANAVGKSKVGLTTARKAQSDKPPAPGMSAIKIILDEPEDNVPSIFRQFGKWLVGELSQDNFKKLAKRNGYFDEIDWLFDIEFDKDVRKAAKDKAKAAKDKDKAAKAAKSKKENPQVDEDDDVESDEFE